MGGLSEKEIVIEKLQVSNVQNLTSRNEVYHFRGAIEFIAGG